MKKILTITILAGLLAWWFWPDQGLRHPPGVLVPNSPVQTPVVDAKTWTKDHYTFTPLAKFELTARVLSRERYRFDSGAALSPVDFALGWGPMSDQTVLDKLSISQGFRWYRWKARELPIAQSDIESHSANMHMIPADRTVANQLLSVRKDQVIELTGYLVKVEADNGWRWVSSTTRTDTGGGSCEVVWVETISIR